MTHLRVKELAEARGLNITTFARKAELSYSTAHGLWHDRVDQYNRRTLDRVAAALGVRVADLFGGEPKERGAEPGPFLPALLHAA